MEGRCWERWYTGSRLCTLTLHCASLSWTSCFRAVLQTDANGQSLLLTSPWHLPSYLWSRNVSITYAFLRLSLLKKLMNSWTLEGRWVTLFRGTLAICVCHQIPHLDSIICSVEVCDDLTFLTAHENISVCCWLLQKVLKIADVS